VVSYKLNQSECNPFGRWNKCVATENFSICTWWYSNNTYILGATLLIYTCRLHIYKLLYTMAYITFSTPLITLQNSVFAFLSGGLLLSLFGWI